MNPENAGSARALRSADVAVRPRMRLDSAEVLKRFYLLERAVTVAAAGWTPALRHLESKAEMARLVWQHSLTADALRERVFELKYPSRQIETGADAAMVRLFEAILHAPSSSAVALGLRTVACPTLRTAYEAYLDTSDDVADGPTYRFLGLAIQEIDEQDDTLERLLDREETIDDAGYAWVSELERRVNAAGGLLGDTRDGADVARVLPGGREFQLIESPGRDPRYHTCGFYWPDTLDSEYAYGEGLTLQVRSAVSHLNEVWAVDTAAAILQALSAPLGWDFVRDAARWLYDESRHMEMGRRRLERWGLDPAEIPLGDYIYEACRGEDPIYRLGMLGYFETKNIGKKQKRAKAFHQMGDELSQLHMDFDWADETLHAEYGRRWIARLLEATGRSSAEWPAVIERCRTLVEERVRQATEQDRSDTRRIADRLLAQARKQGAPAS